MTGRQAIKTLFTVLNWDLYQNNDGQSDEQVTNKRQTNDEQMTTNKNIKNKRIPKNEIKQYFDLS